MTAPTEEDFRLTQWTSCGGCAAKWSGAGLGELLGGFSQTNHQLLVGLAPFDDAAVYRLSNDLALVSTTDFFPPLMDRPSDYGAVAAANACSDVFAMGGSVVLALNIAGFPEGFPVEAISSIFEAAASVVAEAGGIVAGGHTIRTEEPLFGLAVQGLVHPDRVLTKGGAKPGDVLALSKPLGTGIVLAGGTQDQKEAAIAGMRLLNRDASLRLLDFGSEVHAVTDVTGFGLLGHGWEMAERSSATFVFQSELLPTYAGAIEAASAGTRTGGDARNREYLRNRVVSIASPEYEALAYDPQTSGGLLAAVSPRVAHALEDVGFNLVGQVESGPASVILR